MSTSTPKYTLPTARTPSVSTRNTPPSHRGRQPYRPFSRTPLPRSHKTTVSQPISPVDSTQDEDAEQVVDIVLGNDSKDAKGVRIGQSTHVEVVEYKYEDGLHRGIHSSLEVLENDDHGGTIVFDPSTVNPILTEHIPTTRGSTPLTPSVRPKSRTDDTFNNVSRSLRPRMSGDGTGAVLRHLGSAPPRAPRNAKPTRETSDLETNSCDDVKRHKTPTPGSLLSPGSVASITAALPTSSANTKRSAAIPHGRQTVDFVSRPTAQSDDRKHITESRLPDLLAIRPIHPSTHSTDSISTLATKPFALTPLPYKDSDVPLPKAYNEAYPHPLTAYASPGVNPAVVHLSGYDKALDHLLKYEPDKALGTILAESGRDDVCVPSLSMLIVPGEGNGLPERLWSKFESAGAVRLPVGVNGVSPFASGAHQPPTRALPPRFMVRSGSIPDTPPDLPRGDDYFAQLPPRRSFSSDHGQEDMIEDDRSSIRRLSDYDIAASMEKASFGGTPFYKTEMCSSWDQNGHCRYGAQCQYAHGLHELRTSYPLPPMPTEYESPRHVQHHGLPFADQPVPYPRKTSLPGVHLSFIPRIELRRASAPPVHLATVDEVDDEVVLFSPRYRPEVHSRASTIQYELSPFERAHHHHNPDYIPRDRHSIPPNWRDHPQNHEMPPTHTERYLHPNAPGRSITPKASTSSMSTSSSRLSAFASTIDTSQTWSPIEGPSTVTIREDQSPSSSKGSWGKGGLGHTSLDFSSGKSIWC